MMMMMMMTMMTMMTMLKSKGMYLISSSDLRVMEPFRTFNYLRHREEYEVIYAQGGTLAISLLFFELEWNIRLLLYNESTLPLVT